MKLSHLVIIFLALATGAAGCRSSDSAKEQTSERADSTQKVVENPPAPPPREIRPVPVKKNLTFIGASIESIELVDDIQFRAHIFVATAIKEGDTESLLERGTPITVEPLYERNEQGEIDLSIPKNRKLFHLRSAPVRSSFIGRVTYTPDKGWLLIEIVS